MGRKIDSGKVVWIPPETLGRGVGEYREHVGDREDGNRIVAEFGDLVQWVDDAPDDPQDGTGHFERYAGDESAYEPARR